MKRRISEKCSFESKMSSYTPICTSLLLLVFSEKTQSILNNSTKSISEIYNHTQCI